MKAKIAILYSRSSNESIVSKNKLKKQHPNAVVVEKSNKKEISEILDDDRFECISCDKSLNARVKKSEKARLKAKEDALQAQHDEIEKEAKEKAKKEKAEAKAKKEKAKK